MNLDVFKYVQSHENNQGHFSFEW